MSIIDQARAWLARDPDGETRAELQALIDAGDTEALEERFSGTLRFGTAGLRGLLGAGPTRMNRVTVSNATAGFCAWMKRQIPDATARGICVGRDARPNSDVFERDVVEVATAAGIPVFLFSGVVPTPVLAFALLDRKAAGGVMITASHNPPGYNGYKVYWGNGAQIIPPNDVGISREIAAAAESEVPRLPLEDGRARGLVREIDDVRKRYIEAISKELPTGETRAPIRIAYTALHGVAEPVLREVFSRSGFGDVSSVESQAKPDGSFPTVAFPNPEEPGAMDRVLELGSAIDADLILANDPDGDRVAAAARSRDGFEVLSGNDIGILLADDLLAQSETGTPRVVLSTVVSSPLLGAIADAHGAKWEQTLTGHKWIQNRALELETEGFTYIFGYEEALGYATSTKVRDKDGISAALRLADLAARLKTRGHTLVDRRDDLFREHGFVADRQVSVRFEGADASSRMRAAVERVAADPPVEVGGVRVDRVTQPESNVLVFELDGGHRAMLRPSGTEPKLKHYFYAIGHARPSESLASVKTRTEALLDRIARDLTRASGC